MPMLRTRPDLSLIVADTHRRRQIEDAARERELRHARRGADRPTSRWFGTLRRAFGPSTATA